MSNPEDYTVGWISAVKVEYVAARALLDEEHPGPAYVSQRDDNAYTLGRIGQHMIVSATAPDGEYGTTQATAVAMRMIASFPNIRIGLMVGIGGGAPSSEHDIRLGDVVVSAPRDGNGGVFQYDFGKTVQGQAFHTTRFLNQPPTLLRTTVRHLDAVYESDGHQLNEAIQGALKKKPKLRKDYTRPVSTSDQLYHSDFVHPADCQVTCAGHCDSDSSRLIRRAPRDDDEDDPAIHYGLIASGNQMIEDALVHDRLIQEKDVLCFEMEAAGLMNDFPCLVVRGICDYSDSHKSNNWQGYAAMVASAYARDLLLKIAPTRLEAEKRLGEVMGKLAHGIESVRQDTQKTVRHLDTEKCREVLNWIASTDHTATHAKHLSKCQEGTGNWLTNSEAFQQWLETPGQTLFYTGMPGAGKTIMTSIVVDHLQERFRESRDVGLAYIYCDFRRQSEQSVEHMLAVVLRQLVQRYSVYFGIPPGIDDIYHQHRATGNSLSRATLCQALRSLSVYFTRIYIMVDALDECQTAGGCRAKFLEKLFGFQDTTNVNLITTSRPIPDIIQILGMRKNAVRLEIQANKDDLQCYLDGQLGRLPDFVRDDPVLQRKVKNKIVDAVGGMFLLATFHLEFLIEEPTVGDLEIALGKLPRDFFQTYDQAIERIRRQSDSAQKLAKKVLGWVVFAKQPLKCEALQQAVIIKLGKSNSDERFKPSAEKMVSVCAGLVDINSKTREFSLVHYTVHEYLQSQAACNGWFQSMHVHVTHACISYLQTFAETCVKHRDKDIDGDSLIRYVFRNWSAHARANEHLCRDAILNFIFDNDGELRLDSIYAGHSAMGVNLGYTKGWTPLHFTAVHRFFEITTLLLSTGNAACINTQDACGETPLSLAVRSGSEKIVELLLQNGAKIDTTKGETLLLQAAGRSDFVLGAKLWDYAARRNSEYLCEIALRFGIDINTKDEKGNTPLSRSVKYCGSSSISKLLQNGAQVDARNDEEETPLIRTLKDFAERKEIIDLLLLNGADVNSRNGNHETPLLCVLLCVLNTGRYSWSGKMPGIYDHVENMVLTLLQKGAMVNVKTLYGATPIYLAVQISKDICQLLLQYGAEVDTRRVGPDKPVRRYFLCPPLRLGVEMDESGRRYSFRSPLHLAVVLDKSPVVKLFMDQEGVDPNILNSQGRTPLHVACKRTLSKSSLKLLLGRNDVLIDAVDFSGNTPLMIAAKRGCQDSVKQLIQHGADVSVLGKFESFASNELRRYTISYDDEAIAFASTFSFPFLFSHFEPFEIEVRQEDYPRRRMGA